MKAEVTRFVEDLSRKAGQSTLGRSGYSVACGPIYRTFFDEDHGGKDGAYTAACQAVPMIQAKANWDELAEKTWAALDQDVCRKLRQEYALHWNEYPTVAHYALATAIS